MEYTVNKLKEQLSEYLTELVALKSDELRSRRYDKILLGGII